MQPPSSSITLKIQLVDAGVIAFSIDFDQYYHRTEPVPVLYDAGLRPQIIYNYDSWFQAKTHQRYSYRGFLDMAAAFADALRLTYSSTDVDRFAATAALAAGKQILAEQMSDYRKHYWIEVLDPVKIESEYAKLVRDNFDRFRSKLGDDHFYNNLCRFYKVAKKSRPTVASVFEKLIGRLGRIPQEPVYPDHTDLDADLVRAVLTKLGSRDEHRNVDGSILEAVARVGRTG